MPKLLPTSTSTFRDIISGGFLYVDKTEYIYHLTKSSKGAWFLSRPRRFGKSLLISTLEELFLGNHELFHGLWIDDSNYEWAEHAVIRLDFNLMPSRSVEELQDNIKMTLERIATEHDIQLVHTHFHAQFQELILALAKQKPVVILIDEYDKPIIENLENVPEAVQIRDTLKRFYGVIKGMDRHIRMSFITGISKFSKVGIFSDLNNLTDLTLNTQFAATLGLTESEIRHYLADHIAQYAKSRGISEDELMAQLQRWYNGFCFAPEGENVYNPFSTFHLFFHQRFSNYWFESGSPSFLIKQIHSQNYDVESLSNMTVGELAFSTYEIDNLAILPLLFQTGYLTIKSYMPETQLYRLGYPNYEVENAFMVYLLDAISNTPQGISTTHLHHMIEALRTKDLALFFETLNIFFANIDYDLHLKNEKYYQTIFYLIFKLMGLQIDTEVKTNTGRIDAVVALENLVYVFEFKVDQRAEVALQQIQEKSYAQKYEGRGKDITLIGVNFNSELRTIDDWESTKN